MSVSLPNGSTVHIASGVAAALPITILTNAAPPVATSTAHGLANGDLIEVTSGWSRLNNKTVRVAGVTANTFEIEGYDTSSTVIYPAGSGIGSVKKITGWTQLQQILTTSSSGGEQQFATYQFLEDDAETRIPTNKSASGLEVSIADDPTLAGYILASVANDDRVPRSLRVSNPSGSKILYRGYVSLNKTPSLTVNSVMACQVTISFLNEPVRYAS